MFNIIKTAALSALIGLGGLAAMPASAQADSIQFSFGTHGAGVFVGHGGRHYRPQPARYRECTPNRAVNKAASLGVRNARVRNVNRNAIAVRGRDRHGPVVVRFSRAPGCPIIRIR